MQYDVTLSGITNNASTRGMENQPIEITTGEGKNATKEIITYQEYARRIEEAGIKGGPTKANMKLYNQQIAEKLGVVVTISTDTMTKGPDGKLQKGKVSSRWAPEEWSKPTTAAAKETAPAPSGASSLVTGASVSSTGGEQIHDVAVRNMVLRSKGTPERAASAGSVASPATTYSPVGGEVLTGIHTGANRGGGKWSIPPEYQEALQHTFKRGSGVAKEMARAGYESAKDLAAAGWRRFTGLFSGPSFSEQATATLVAMREHVQSGQ